MKNTTCKKDLELIPQIFGYSSPENLPISFRYGEQLIHGIPADFSPTVQTERIDANIIRKTIVGKDCAGLEIKVVYTQYIDFAATEFLAFFTNTGDTETTVISDIKIIDGVLCGKNATLIHGNGDTLGEDGYEWYMDDLKQPVKKTPRDGTSCNGAFPYMRLMFDGYGVNIGIGWPAMWSAEFAKENSGVAVSIGQRRCHMKILPGETIRTPRVNFVAFSGDETRGINVWRRWYFAHILPRENGKPLSPKWCLHVFEAGGHPEFTGATEGNQLLGIREYVRKGLKPDIWWIDAGWYPCNYNWHDSGAWEVDKQRFPNGLAPIGQACRDNDIDFLLWFEPERVHDGSWIETHRPEWLIRHRLPDGSFEPDSLLNLGIKECCDYIIDTVDAIIKEGNVKIYRQDFNYDPAPCWESAESEDRIGAVENLHVQGYLRFWDTLLDRNPGLWIDSCSSGGRRNDLETMRRAVTLHYTDVGYGNHPIKQKQHRQMFEWIPYFRAHNMNWDDPVDKHYEYINHIPDKYSYYAAMTPSVTDMTTFDADESCFELAKKMQAIWREAAPLMLSGDFYPLTVCRKSAEDFFAVQFHDPDAEKGFLLLMSNNQNQQNVFRAAFKGLNEHTDYILRNCETGEKNVYAAQTLINGIDFNLAQRSGIIYFYEGVQK